MVIAKTFENTFLPSATPRPRTSAQFRPASADQVIEVAKSLTRAGWWLSNTADKGLEVDDHMALTTATIGEHKPAVTEELF
ncbi:hypothetical protein [Citricoccus muralis]|uniref:Uncharacterized protein n=1 Tax=Citricoccus muralis TaxID=169134 RepID=A0A3D9LII5_9MICC|nr:hypothetical protein [Citricoccus muralis]REE05267.1 hypothetical protein C8E99_3140 [Citricoccus muralis]